MCPDAECVYAIHLPNEERTLLAGVLAEDAAKYCENVIAFEKADAHSDLEEALKTAYRNAKKETEENQKHKTLQQLDTPWDEIVTEEELDTSSEGETEEDAFDKESETESESESEMEIPEGCYQVVLPQSTEYEISFCAETQWYQPGEEV